MSHPNEYWEDERLYIKVIERCVCTEKTGSGNTARYRLVCKIIQRGEHGYIYSQDQGYISKKPDSKKKLWLSEDAKRAVQEAIDSFNDFITRAENGSMGKAVIYPDLVMYYSRVSEYFFDVLYHSVISGDYLLERNKPLDNMVRWIPWQFRDKADNGDLQTDPILLSAVESGDMMLYYQIKEIKGTTSEDDCAALADILGRRVLPSLPEEYNKTYVVDTEKIDRLLLRDSGYRVLHRPYFAMKGSTHSKWQLNPCEKSIVDAAIKDAESISFDEYLKLFENI